MKDYEVGDSIPLDELDTTTNPEITLVLGDPKRDSEQTGSIGVFSLFMLFVILFALFWGTGALVSYFQKRQFMLRTSRVRLI
ncbi:MAG: hypothetical protein P1V97_28770, partial [Planctomycetota bacterium]|nr:hypothetical protein [Planctomycetota bacterium]